MISTEDNDYKRPANAFLQMLRIVLFTTSFSVWKCVIFFPRNTIFVNVDAGNKTPPPHPHTDRFSLRNNFYTFQQEEQTNTCHNNQNHPKIVSSHHRQCLFLSAQTFTID